MKESGGIYIVVVVVVVVVVIIVVVIVFCSGEMNQPLSRQRMLSATVGRPRVKEKTQKGGLPP